MEYHFPVFREIHATSAWVIVAKLIITILNEQHAELVRLRNEGKPEPEPEQVYPLVPCNTCGKPHNGRPNDMCDTCSVELDVALGIDDAI